MTSCPPRSLPTSGTSCSPRNPLSANHHLKNSFSSRRMGPPTVCPLNLPCKSSATEIRKPFLEQSNKSRFRKGCIWWTPLTFGRSARSLAAASNANAERSGKISIDFTEEEAYRVANKFRFQSPFHFTSSYGVETSVCGGVCTSDSEVEIKPNRFHFSQPFSPSKPPLFTSLFLFFPYPFPWKAGFPPSCRLEIRMS